MKKYAAILSGVLLLFAAACVPKRDLTHEQARVKGLQKDSTATHSSLSDCNSQVSDLQKNKADLQNSIKELSSSYQENMSNSNMTIADQAKRLKSMEDLIQRQKD